jgi:hypothetical protein
MKQLVFLLIAFLYSVNTYAQNSFGVEIGVVSIDQFSPLHQFDSIVVIPLNNKSFNTRSLGIFFEMKLSDRFAIHQKLNYSRAYNSYLYFNKNQEGVLGVPTQKAGGPSVTRVSWEILPQLSIIELGNLRLSVFGGLNVSGNIVRDQEQFSWRGLPGVSKVGNAFRSSQMPVTMNFAYGASIEYAQRLVFWAKWQPRADYSRDIEIDGERYPFKNQWKFFTMTIGYRFYSFKFKNASKM